MKKLICCFCGNECENKFGNDSWPLENGTKDRCCNKCNLSIVIPARINLENIYTKGDEKHENMVIRKAI